ncbi:MAG: TIGR01212 family radical SAM protein [Ruminococcus sp.]|nr:TIGR01212 family radical SAM protein [Ruminococcus sp.]
MKYTLLSSYLKNKYGKKYYKLSLSCSTTCPNRDGLCGDKGCIFCSSKGSGDFAQNVLLPVDKQIERAKELVKAKSDDNKYIAYFQAFTSTYGDFEYLRNVFYETIKRDDIAILSIATRPDCLGDEIIKLLEELNKNKPVWVELGLQTIHESSAVYIRRGYNTNVYFEAVKKLHAIGVHVITHIIVGLPFETKDMIVETARAVGKVTDGVKLQLLHILKGTDLATNFEKGEFDLLSLEEYADIICECINAMPENIVIHRLTGDGDKNTLIAPLWTRDKKRVLNYINHKIAVFERTI